MVKSSLGFKLFLALVMVMVNVVTIAPSLPILSPQLETMEDESSMRIERSANLSHITATSKKIRMYIRNKYLQIFADGTVNATDDENSDYTILQRSSVNAGQVKIQGVATCTFLCMDPCGLLYSTREFGDECVFHELIEQHYYNTYSSAKYSNEKRILYIGLTKRGTSRKVQVKSGTPLGKLSSYTKVLPQPVENHVVERLTNKLLALHPNPQHHNLRHHQVCPPPYHMKITESLKCKRKRKKKKRRKCHENEEENEECQIVKTEDPKKPAKKKKCDDTDTAAECQPKKGKKRKADGNKKKPSKSPKKDSAERNAEADEDDTMTTTIPDDGAEDEFLDNDN